jgi:hypothetical protein
VDVAEKTEAQTDLAASAFEQRVRRLIEVIFVPARTITPQHLSKATFIFIGLVLFTTVMMAEPHIKKLYMTYFLKVDCFPAATKEVVKEYCDFAIIAFQVLIAIVVGGIVITDNMVSAAQRLMSSLESTLGKKSEAEREKLLAELHGVADEVKAACIGVTLRNCVPRGKRVLDALTIVNATLGTDIPKFYMRLFLFRVGASFPKGLYGVLALALFEGMLISQVVKSFYEYAPSCPP